MPWSDRTCRVKKYEQWSVLSTRWTQTPASEWRGLVAEWDKALVSHCPEMRRNIMSIRRLQVQMMALPRFA
jgi:hypothetical protein